LFEFFLCDGFTFRRRTTMTFELQEPLTLNMPRAYHAWAALLLVLAGVCLPAHGDEFDPTYGDVVLFPGPMQEMQAAGEPDAAVSRPPLIGWNIPGKNFRAGEGWWGLVCDAGCRLSPMRLGVTPAMHGQYDGDPLPSQFLSWSPMPAGLPGHADHNGETAAPVNPLIAVFKPIRTLAGLPLAAGPVKTWLHRGMAQYPAGGRLGTMEIAIAVQPGVNALLVPRLIRASASPGDAAQNTSEADTLMLELRIGERRQRLGVFGEGIEGMLPVPPKTYLLWAGDLDGDGKLDLLVDLSGTGITSSVTLFLSTLAKGGDLVGEAGRFNFTDPSASGC
jgi:hypothetical protein